MATLEESKTLAADATLRNKVESAIVRAAYAKLTAVPLVTNDVKWADSVIDNPEIAAQKALALVIAANEGATMAQITGATDAAIQANVDGVVPALILAFV